jgi:hypothetical protein
MLNMKTSTSIRLTGTIVTSQLDERSKPTERRLILSVEVGQPDPVIVQIAVSTAEGQKALNSICRCTGVFKMQDAQELVGRELPLEVVQLNVQGGLVQPLICVGVTQWC